MTLYSRLSEAFTQEYIARVDHRLKRSEIRCHPETGAALIADITPQDFLMPMPDEHYLLRFPAGIFVVWPDTNVPVGRVEVWLTDHDPSDGPVGPYIVVGSATT